MTQREFVSWRKVREQRGFLDDVSHAISLNIFYNRLSGTDSEVVKRKT